MTILERLSALLEAYQMELLFREQRLQDWEADLNERERLFQEKTKQR